MHAYKPLYMYYFLCACIIVRMYACPYVCSFVYRFICVDHIWNDSCIYAWWHMYVYVCLFVCMNVWICVWKHVFVYIFICVHQWEYVWMNLHSSVCSNVCLSVFILADMYIWTYVCIFLGTVLYFGRYKYVWLCFFSATMYMYLLGTMQYLYWPLYALDCISCQL